MAVSGNEPQLVNHKLDKTWKYEKANILHHHSFSVQKLGGEPFKRKTLSPSNSGDSYY